ncbi:YqiJ family protein [Novosphingobium sp. 9]|uniref:YqiJ family protein n=1 Tax=Novosphingobium sp. 9 TaxID=2025349 RepID=UPI0021B580AB|nr:YqiJ family protein [Novosphingobium sp. 9]
MLELLGLAQSLPFTAAIGLMLMLALLQVAGAADLLGSHIDAHIDSHLDAHAGSDHGMPVDAGLLSLIGLGRVPFLVWLMLLLTLFGLIGLGAQGLLLSLTGQPLTAWIVGPLTGIAALPATGLASRPLAHLLPSDETSAIHVGSLVGREGEIVVGTASPGNPARARVIDTYGQAHHVMLEPDSADQRFVTGEKVLLVRREGELFKAIARGDHYLPRLDG